MPINLPALGNLTKVTMSPKGTVTVTVAETRTMRCDDPRCPLRHAVEDIQASYVVEATPDVFRALAERFTELSTR